jgi:hypothetical protein
VFWLKLYKVKSVKETPGEARWRDPLACGEGPSVVLWSYLNEDFMPLRGHTL